MSTSSSIDKVVFVLSVAVLSFFVGAGVGAWEWFPHSYLERAVHQGRSMYRAWVSPGNPRFMGPQVYERSGTRAVEPSRIQPGLTLVASYWHWTGVDRWETGAKLLDSSGRVVHQWRVDRRTLFPDSVDLETDPTTAELHGVHLSPNGDLLVNFDYVGTARLDACGGVEWTLPEKTHHSIAQATDGTLWIPGVSSTRRTTSARYPNGYPGVDTPIWLDQLLHVRANGSVLDRINVLDILYANDLQRHLVRGLGPYPESLPPDPTHLNDVEPLPARWADEYPLFDAGDLLVSLRHPSLVFVLDPESGEVEWHASHPFIHQHDPDFVGDGWIGIFDNNEDPTPRGSMLGGSRIVMLQSHTDSVRVPFPTARSAPLYTATAGSWQMLDNGNLLLTEARAGRVVEVAPDGRTVWEWVRASYDETVPFVMNATRHSLTREDVAKWPCASVDSVDGGG